MNDESHIDETVFKEFEYAFITALKLHTQKFGVGKFFKLFFKAFI